MDEERIRDLLEIIRLDEEETTLRITVGQLRELLAYLFREDAVDLVRRMLADPKG